MQEIIGAIDKQLRDNRGKNIFNDMPGLFIFNNDTIRSLSELVSLSSDSLKFLLDYATDKAIAEFCRVNQYFAFNSESRCDLNSVYADLLNDISAKVLTVDQISDIHYGRLRAWLRKYNSFAEKMYSAEDKNVNLVPCSEYNAELQLQILGINSNEIMSPVLDVGCGKSGNLVRHLRENGINAFGIDRCSFDCDFLGNSDWLEYNYGNEKWGTIISNLGFSNHFTHHNLRSDGDFVTYAKTYMNILQSLLPGGSFYYAPDLPFIEKYLDTKKFRLYKNKIDDYDFMSSVIRKV